MPALTQPGTGMVHAGPMTTCASCGVIFWLAADFEQRRQEDHQRFYCPNGHGLSFNAETDAEKYRRLFRAAEDRAAAVRAERDQAEAGRRAWKGQATRLKNRAKEGNCPFCDQHLRDLERHISRKHPGEIPEVVE